MKVSALQQNRYGYKPKLPRILSEKLETIAATGSGATKSVADQEELKALFSNTYGKPFVTFTKGKNPGV